MAGLTFKCLLDRHSLQANVISRMCPGNNSANCFCKASTFSYAPRILSETQSVLLTWHVRMYKRFGKIVNINVKSRNEDVVFSSIYLGREIRRKWKTQRREKGRKEGGRGGGCLKNAACVATATGKTTRGSPWLRPPPPHSLLLQLLLLSIHFTIWCYFFQLICLLVFHKQHFCGWLVLPLKEDM